MARHGAHRRRPGRGGLGACRTGDVLRPDAEGDGPHAGGPGGPRHRPRQHRRRPAPAQLHPAVDGVRRLVGGRPGDADGPPAHPAETTRLLDLCEPQFHLAVEGPVPLSAPFREECEIVVLPRRSGRPAQVPTAWCSSARAPPACPRSSGAPGGRCSTNWSVSPGCPTCPGAVNACSCSARWRTPSGSSGACCTACGPASRCTSAAAPSRASCCGCSRSGRSTRCSGCRSTSTC